MMQLFELCDAQCAYLINSRLARIKLIKYADRYCTCTSLSSEIDYCISSIEAEIY